jgi:hypothetical protein
MHSRDRGGPLPVQDRALTQAEQSMNAAFRAGRTRAVLAEIEAERQAQDAQWGEQNHPLGFGGHLNRLRADQCRAECDEAAERGEVTWRHILLEELYEALAEGSARAARDELIQLAAVAVAAVERIDRMPGA